MSGVACNYIIVVCRWDKQSDNTQSKYQSALSNVLENISEQKMSQNQYGFCSKTWLVSHFLDIITFYHFFQRPAHYKILSIISAELIEIKSIVRTVMSSPISSSLLSPFLFIRYFFTITLCKDSCIPQVSLLRMRVTSSESNDQV